MREGRGSAFHERDIPHIVLVWCIEYWRWWSSLVAVVAVGMLLLIGNYRMSTFQIVA